MKTFLKFSLIIAIIFGAFNVNAQEEEEKQETKVRPIQISFITPLGTNGIDAWKYTNRLSVNIFAGYNGGVQGIEVGGFANILKEDLTGIQLAGFANHVNGHTKGIQLSGYYNFSLKSMYGIQGSGFFNGSHGKTEGLQIAGFLNYAGKGDASQISLFSNVTLANVKGIQAAGFANIALKKVKGIQAAGFYNQAENVKGIQASGFANIATKDVKGIQVSGFINYARKVKGAQIGFINFADTIEDGVAIGFLSFVKNGYQAIEIGGNESQYGYINFKTGTHRFYNIISLGASIKDEKILYGWGYGVGSYLELGKKLGLNIEAIGYHMNEDEWFTHHLNQNYKAQALFSYNITKHFAIYGGPTWNVNVSETKHHGEVFESSIAPYTVFDKTYDDDIRVSMYPGFSAGIRIF